MRDCPYCAPDERCALHLRPQILRGADRIQRIRRACSHCRRVRLTTETTHGPLCNDCLTQR